MDLFNSNGAIFSECRKYRYVLWRKWDEAKPMAMFIGLNPSTANEIEPDNTITKVKKVAANNGYGGFYMLNLFAIISKEPEILETCDDPIKDNDTYLVRYAAKSEAIIYCWGAFKQAKHRYKTVVDLINRPAMCFKLTKDGHPWHPLYCKDKTIFTSFKL